MGKMMGLASIRRMLDAARSSSPPSPIYPSWTWPSCKHPRTSSFREGEDVYRTVNSIYFDATDPASAANPWQENRSPSSLSAEEEARGRTTLSRAIEEDQEEEPSMVDIIRGLRSDRLFFEPRGKAISVTAGGRGQEPKTITSIEETVVAAADREGTAPAPVTFKESVAEELESDDPYLDFRASMEEMVMAYELKDWGGLEELLGWYLRMNGKNTHTFILGAFVDLILDLASSFRPPVHSSCSSCSCSNSCSSTTTTASSSSVKFVAKEAKMEQQEDHHFAWS